MTLSIDKPERIMQGSSFDMRGDRKHILLISFHFVAINQFASCLLKRNGASKADTYPVDQNVIERVRSYLRSGVRYIDNIVGEDRRIFYLPVPNIRHVYQDDTFFSGRISSNHSDIGFISGE